MIPPFDLQGGAPLAIVRGIAVAGLLSTSGTLAFRNLVLPKAFVRAPADLAVSVKRRLLVLAQASVAVTLLALLAWLVFESANMADANSLSAAFAAVPTVLRATSFGHAIALQVAALVLLAATIGRRDTHLRLRVAFGVATLALCLQAWHSHAAAMDEEPSLLLGMDVLHLLGAGGWLGGLLPLLIVVRHAPPALGAMAARWFSPLGQVCVGLLAISALVQGWVLVGSVPGLVGTAYGWMVLVKLALSAVLLAFAALNRYRFAPTLLHAADPQSAKHILVRSITLQTGAALAIVAAAVVLSGLPPAMHLQPIWPFPRRIDFSAVQEDPDFLREAVLAGLSLAAALAILAAAFLWRRWRLLAIATAALIAWFAVPHLDVLLADANPTSFYHSPTGFSSDTIVEGAALFGPNCAVCHGAAGLGDGPLAKTLPVPPANLAADHVLMHDDGEMFWWLSHGIHTPEGAQAMPGFAARLTDDQRWSLIDYVRAHNLGMASRATGTWPQPVHAPGFQARCGDAIIQSSDFQASFVRLVIGAPPSGPAQPGLIEIGTQTGPPGACVAGDAKVPAAYAIISGVSADALAGTQFLIDRAGWLRAMQRPGAAMGWDDAKMLSAELQSLRQHPVASAPGEMHMDMKM